MTFSSTRRSSSNRGGGRAPSKGDELNSDGTEQQHQQQPWKATPCQEGEARLIVIQITDVYTLEHLASVKTLIEDTKAKAIGATVISVITGDFLSPYLLSSIDQGAAMMNALSKIPIDYISWGNHEADVKHKVVCKHVRNFQGTWLNSNMLDHEAMDAQKEFDIVDIVSPDGSTNKRKVGLVAVLSNEPALYSQFKSPGAFGGATIDDPWETLAKYKKMLEGPDYQCDMVLPFEHLYVPDDHKTCRMFDFPAVLSGHDHHRVDQVIEGTRLLKPGMDAIYATILELSWPDGEKATRPIVSATHVKTDDWEPDPELAEENERAYDVLAPLRNTELARVPPMFEPLSSMNVRGNVCSMGKFLCTLLKSSMNLSRRQRNLQVDAVVLKGGNIRGNTEYPKGSFFSLEALEAEISPDQDVGVVLMPGWLLAKGITESHSNGPNPGWMQYDIGVVQDGQLTVTQVGGEPIDPDRNYRVATKIADLTDEQSPVWKEYYTSHPDLLPPKGAYTNIQSELLSYFARNLWRKIWDGLSEQIEKECTAATVMVDNNNNKCNPQRRLELLDSDQDGLISLMDIQKALQDIVGLSVDDRELTLAEFVHGFADTNNDGTVTIKDMEIFCEEMEEVHERDKWRLSYPRSESKKK